VVIFLKPTAGDINILLDMLQLFGEASGLKTNVQKSSVLPIQCQEDRQTIETLLPCQLLEFSCRYLGLPLSLHKLTKAQIQPIIDKVADQLPGWKADLLNINPRLFISLFDMSSDTCQIKRKHVV
jgi:hypothetical protein